MNCSTFAAAARAVLVLPFTAIVMMFAFLPGAAPVLAQPANISALLVLRVRGEAGDWHRYGHLRMFNEPNDVANGQVYVADTLNWRVQKYVKQ